MSDCFDHEFDAMESRDMEGYGCTNPRGGPSFSRSSSSRDPLYYHDLVDFNSIDHETDKAYFLNTDDGSYWVPKSLCKNINRAMGEVYIWTQFKPSHIEPNNT